MVVGLEPKDGIKDPDRLLCSLQNIDDTRKRTVRGVIEHVIGNDFFSDGTVSPDEQTSEHSSRSIDDTETSDPDQHTLVTRSSNSGGEGHSKYKDKYTEERKLGYGGFGCVYKCRNNSDDSNYAVKFVAFDECREELRELRAMSLAQHPNVVRCVDHLRERIREGEI